MSLPCLRHQSILVGLWGFLRRLLSVLFVHPSFFLLLIQIRFAPQLWCTVDKEQAYIGTPSSRAAKTQLQWYDDENVALRKALQFSRLAWQVPCPAANICGQWWSLIEMSRALCGLSFRSMLTCALVLFLLPVSASTNSLKWLGSTQEANVSC